MRSGVTVLVHRTKQKLQLLFGTTRCTASRPSGRSTQMDGPSVWVGSLASTLVLAGVAAIFVFHPLTPALPRAGIDPSWVAVMGELADRPTRFGVDTAFTYGPASPIVTGYLNAAWLSRTLPLQLAFAGLFGWCAALLVARHRPGRVAFVGTAACGLMLVAARATPDALFLSLPFLVFLLALRREPGRAEAGAALLGALALGLTAMMKMSFPLSALPLLALADGLGLVRRRIPRFLPLFALGVGAGALLYGQRLGDLPAYLALQGEVVAGYAAAMAIDGPDWDLYAFLVSAVALLATAVLARRGPDRWPVALGLGIALLFLFKAGFIRHDLHSTIAWTGLALVGTVLARAGLPRRAALAVTLAACFIVAVYEPVVTMRQSVRGGRAAALARLYADVLEMPAHQAAAAWDALRDPAGFGARLAAAKADAWTGVARAMPLGSLPGGVDIIPSAQTAVLAAGLDYRGRPSFQEYSTYTAALAGANRAFLESPAAPRWILFGPESPEGYMGLDSRFPALAEGPLWPDLLRLYRPDHRIGALVALERRAAPAPLIMGPPRSFAVRFGTVAPLDADGPTWATLDMPLNLAGRVLSALFRPPLLTLAVTLGDGTERRFRLVPALAAAGFLLSPLVDNASDYEALSAGRAAGAARRVTGFAVEVSAAGRWFYAPNVAVALRSLDLSGLGAPLPRALPTGPIPAPSSGIVSLPVRERRVTLAYGLAVGASRPVCFSAEPADGTKRLLWSACLEPGAEPGRVTLAVPDGVDELALATRCGGDACPATWTVAPGG